MEDDLVLEWFIHWFQSLMCLRLGIRGEEAESMFDKSDDITERMTQEQRDEMSRRYWDYRDRCMVIKENAYW